MPLGLGGRTAAGALALSLPLAQPYLEPGDPLQRRAGAGSLLGGGARAAANPVSTGLATAAGEGDDGRRAAAVRAGHLALATQVSRFSQRAPALPLDPAPVFHRGARVANTACSARPLLQGRAGRGAERLAPRPDSGGGACCRSKPAHHRVARRVRSARLPTLARPAHRERTPVLGSEHGRSRTTDFALQSTRRHPSTAAACRWPGLITLPPRASAGRSGVHGGSIGRVRSCLIVAFSRRALRSGVNRPPASSRPGVHAAARHERFASRCAGFGRRPVR
jgi:hypothetical protein